MTLRTKALLALIALSAAATVSIGSLAYVATGQQLTSEIDTSLRAVAVYAATQSDHGGGGGGGPDGQTATKPYAVVVQVLGSDGSVSSALSGISVPVSAGDRAIAVGANSTSEYRDVEIAGHGYRMLTTPVGHEGGAVQVLRPLSDRDRALSALGAEILLAALIVITAAAVTGWLLARQITGRLRALAGAAGLVAATGRLDVAVPDAGRDEVSQVAGDFRRMLEVLHRSEVAQRRLVEDAGHELRTPLTSLRTNLDVLDRYPQLPSDDRGRVIADLHSEIRELTALVNELVDLTAGEAPAREPEQVMLGDVARRVVDRAVRRSGRAIELSSDTSVTLGHPAALERAVGNLVDNALKFSPGPEPIEVTVSGGTVEVRDHGPGLADGDLPRIFDRFYRAADARQLPGSGLGLAIVHDIAASHGGTVHARNERGGGAVIGMVLPSDAGEFTPSSNPG